MQKSIIDEIKNLFGDHFQKKVRRADSLKEIKRRLSSKRAVLQKRIKECKSNSERKLIEKKLKVLKEQIKKIDKKLSS